MNYQDRRFELYENKIIKFISLVDDPDVNKHKLGYNTLVSRIRKGMPLKQAFNLPGKENGKIHKTIKGGKNGRWQGVTDEAVDCLLNGNINQFLRLERVRNS